MLAGVAEGVESRLFGENFSPVAESQGECGSY